MVHYQAAESEVGEFDELSSKLLEMIEDRLGSDLAREAIDWWRSEGSGSPSFVDKLIEVKVLSKSSKNSLKLVSKGYVVLDDYSTLLMKSDSPDPLADLLRSLSSTSAKQVEEKIVDDEVEDRTGTSTHFNFGEFANQNNRSESMLDRSEQTSVYTAKTNIKPNVKDRRSTQSLKALSIDVGHVLGKVLLTEKVGHGSSGRVFRGFHQTLKIQVAVKVFPKAAMDDNDPFREFIESEAHLLAQLNHPSIVRILDLDYFGQHPYLVLEYIDGLNLAELIKQSGKLSTRSSLRLCLDVAEGLNCAMSQNIVHRDVKPANIFISKSGQAKIGDFGLATCAEDNAVIDSAGHNPVGTPAYMAPEQAFGTANVDHRADIYALGVTLYECLTGERVFQSKDILQLLAMHLKTPPRPPIELNGQIPKAVNDMVLKMLKKNPENRYQTYDELIDDLRRYYEAVTEGRSKNREQRGSSSIFGVLTSWFSRQEIQDLASEE